MITIANRLRLALDRYDGSARECPARKQNLGDAVCPKCRSGPQDGCGLEIRGSYDFVAEVRAICEQAEQPQPSARWQKPSIADMPY